MMITLSHLYPDGAAAGDAIKELRAAGLPEDDMGVIASTRRVRMRNADLENAGDRIDRNGDGADDRIEAAENGAGVGAVVGGAAGLLAGFGLLALPGIGPVVAGGWLATAITGALTGGAAGGVIGALVQAGVSENDADGYLEGVKRGSTLVTIRLAAEDRALYEEILNRDAVGASGASPLPLSIPGSETTSR